jgi:outer membrane protein assembly factor BamE (lipoprotein component of BamABCDE complex)
MIRLLTAAASLACAAVLAGCAGGGAIPEGTPGVIRTAGVTPQAASQSIAGKTRGDVAATLGSAAVVHFDSGYEVWVYRWPGADRTSRTATELVVLFEPSGTVKKTRVRPGYPPDRK